MNEKDFEELAAGAALHALSADDERRYRAALAEHLEGEETVDADIATAALLSDSVEPVTPPAHIRSALLAQIATIPQDGEDRTDREVSDDAPRLEPSNGSAPEGQPEREKPRRWTRTIFALAACLALLVGVGVGAIALNQQLNPPASVVALQEIEASGDAQQATVELDGGGTATAHWSGSAGKAVLVADGLPSAGDGKTYELWFVRGDAPVSAGVFDVDGGDATALLDGDMQAGGTSAERSAGSNFPARKSKTPGQRC